MRSPIRLIFDMLPLVAIIFWILIEGYGALLGPASHQALKRLEREKEEIASQVAILEAQRDALQNRARLLNPNSLDPDILDERARAVLGYVAPGDVVIHRDQFEDILRDSEARLTAD